MIGGIVHMIRVLLFLLIAAPPLFCQTNSSKFHFKQLDVQNGLAQNIVYHFLQDSRGYMWIGTHHGLTLFDGTKSNSFLHDEADSNTLSGNFISSIVEDPLNQIWIGNEAGINRYNRRNNTFTHFGVERPDGSYDNTYCVLLGFVTPDSLWFLDTKTRSVRVFNPSSQHSSLVAPLNSSHALLYRTPGQHINIWSAYDKGTIHMVFKHGKLISQKTFFTGKETDPAFPQLEVTHILQQNDTCAWLSTNEGLVKLNPVNGQYQVLNQWQQQSVKEARYTAISPKGRLWVATGPSGIYEFDIPTNAFIGNQRNNKLDPFSLCSDNIVSLYFDHSGNLWCGSFGNGSSYASIETEFFTTCLSKDETRPYNTGNTIEWLGSDPDGTVWCILTEAAGLWKLDDDLRIAEQKIPIFENGAPFKGSVYRVLTTSKDRFFFGTNRGLWLFNPVTGRTYPISYKLLSEEVQGSIWIRDLISLSDGSILFSTYVGLYHAREISGNWEVNPVNFLEPGAYEGFGNLFQDPNGIIYVKSLGDSLYILKPAGSANEFELMRSLRFKPGINQFYHEDGDSLIYLGTEDGLFSINRQNSQINKILFNQAIPFRVIRSLLKKDDRFWLFGDKGAYFYNEKTREGRAYNIEDGLPANEFTASALVKLPGKDWVAGSSNGLVLFSPLAGQNSIYPPRPQITKIYVNDTLYHLNENPDETEQISLRNWENTFSVDFAPITFQHASQCSFEFRLEGYDENWIKSDVAHYIRYSKIPPGTYQFRLRVLDAMGRVSPYTKSMEILVARSFWQTPLFRILVFSFLVLILWLISRAYLDYRMRKQKMEFEKQQAVERERTRIATDMHDDLGAGLTRIKFITESISEKTQDPDLELETEKLRYSSNELVDKMSEIIWAMNDKNNTLEDLVFYMRSYTVEYCQENGLECDFRIPDEFPELIIGGQIRRNVFLILKECLHNIVKHAKAKRVFVEVKSGKEFLLLVQDDGKGLDEHQKQAGNGLLSMKRRATSLKGRLSIGGTKGTAIQLEIPI